MNIVIAPDSFKGSLTSTEVSNIISKAFTEEIPDSSIYAVPMADGGEGTIDSLVFSTKGIKKEVEATGPLLLRCKTYYGVLGDGKTVVIEVASICGITMLQPFEKNPFLTSTYGVGEVIKYALEQGYRQFIIGLGGSATNDGGLGMLQALGATFKDKYGHKINPIGNSLPEIKFIDFSTLDQRIYESDIKVASDVENPLCGKNGASFVFGPQKGATREQIEKLDNALFNYANLVERELSKSMKDTPGAGAAGGLGFAFLAIGAELIPGARIVADAAGLREKIIRADWVITGEGQSDFQTLFGKAPIYVAKMAKELNVKSLLISGSLGEGYQQLYNYFVSCHSITRGPISLDNCIEIADELLYESSRNIARLLNCLIS